jgi:hypothetical protein
MAKHFHEKLQKMNLSGVEQQQQTPFPFVRSESHKYYTTNAPDVIEPKTPNQSHPRVQGKFDCFTSRPSLKPRTYIESLR